MLIPPRATLVDSFVRGELSHHGFQLISADAMASSGVGFKISNPNAKQSCGCGK
jgi:hypothetical protein